MSINVLLRRAKLGASSCAGIAAASQEKITPILLGRDPVEGEVFYLFRWGCTATLPAAHTVQSPVAIHTAHDKAESRRIFQTAGLRTPETWFHPDEVPEEALEGGVITRPAHHHQGRMLFRSRTRSGLWYSYQKCCRYDPSGRAYISAFVPKEREFRVYVIQGRVAAVAEKHHPGGSEVVAWNKARGGSFSNVRWGDWPLAAAVEAVKATKAIGLDFAGIDVMTRGEEEEEVWLLEPNAAPSLTSPYRQGVFAKCFDWMIAYGKGTIEVPQQVSSYKDLLHPALTVGPVETTE